MRIVERRLEKGSLLRITGPAMLMVGTGKISVLGAVYGPGSRLVLHKCRSYAVKALEGSEIRVTLGDEGSLEEPRPGEEVIDQWLEVAERVVSDGGRVILIGGVESGKTSLTALIANVALSQGRKVAVVDGDVGQADVGPPAFVSMGFVDKSVVWLRDLSADAMRFIGTVAPGPAAGSIVVSVRELVEEAERRGADTVVVDTDGWISGMGALVYKLALIRSLQPARVVLVGPGLEPLANILSRTNMEVYTVGSPARRRERSREERRILRAEGYKRYLEGGETVRINALDSPVLGSCVFSGTPLPSEEVEAISAILGVKVLRASRLSGTLTVAAESRPGREALSKLRDAYPGDHVYVVTPSDAKGLLVAVTDRSLRELGPGLVVSIDYESGVILVRTRYSESAEGIIVGRVKLDENYVEMGRITGCVI